MRLGPWGRLGRWLLVCALVGAFALVGAAGAQAQEDPITWSLGKPPVSVTAGQTFRIQATAKIEAGWHLYAISQAPPPIATRLSVPQGQMFTIDGSVDAPAPHVAYDQGFQMDTETYSESAVFSVPVKATVQASGKQVLRVNAYYQTCNDTICLPPKTVKLESAPIDVKPASAADVAAAATAAQAAPPPPAAPQAPAAQPSAPANAQPGSTSSSAMPGAPSGTSVPTAGAAAPPLAAGQVVPAQSGSAAPPSTAAGTPSAGRPAAPAFNPAASDDAAAAAANGSLLSFLLLAMVSGAFALLTPCVFPMVPITVSYFTGHAAGHRGHALRNASIYGLGIILTFTAFGMLLALFMGATSLNRFAASPWINLLITAIFVGFALNLFGVFELNVPSGVLTRLDNITRQEGGSEVIGALLMGFTFTLTSFTCTVPFVGNVAVIAAGGGWLRPVVGMVAFSSVFALPFFLLALMPQYAAQMPRSGAWLHAVKVLMAFLEIAAAMKFISNVDLVWRWGIFTREVVLATWVVIAACMALYLMGVFRFPGEPRVRKVRAGRWLLATACLLLGGWLFLGVMGRRLGELEAFLPPAEGIQALAANDQASGIKGELTWIMNDYQGALAQARKEHKRLMVDFTGYTCTNCRWMEANMFPRPDVRAELDRYVRVRMYTDGEGEIFQKQQALQQAMFKTVALPYYAILNEQGDPIATFPGLTRDPAKFVGFLKSGLL
jgi:thiol:disulfide interchange protein